MGDVLLARLRCLASLGEELPRFIETWSGWVREDTQRAPPTQRWRWRWGKDCVRVTEMG